MLQRAERVLVADLGARAMSVTVWSVAGEMLEDALVGRRRGRGGFEVEPH